MVIFFVNKSLAVQPLSARMRWPGLSKSKIPLCSMVKRSLEFPENPFETKQTHRTATGLDIHKFETLQCLQDTYPLGCGSPKRSTADAISFTVDPAPKSSCRRNSYSFTVDPVDLLVLSQHAYCLFNIVISYTVEMLAEIVALRTRSLGYTYAELLVSLHFSFQDTRLNRRLILVH